MDFLPGAVQVLIEWLMLAISTILGYFYPHKKEEVPTEEADG